MPKLIHASYPPAAAAYIRATGPYQIPAAGSNGSGKGLKVTTSHFGVKTWSGFDWSTVNVEGQVLYTTITGLTYAKSVMLAVTEREPSRIFVITTSHRKDNEVREFTDADKAEAYLFKQYERLK